LVWYPSVDDIVCLNILALDMTGDRHPHKLLGSRKGIKSIIDAVRQEEDRGLAYQAAVLMKRLTGKHAFAGGNHRTAYLTAKSFIVRNGRRFRIDNFEEAYPFIKNLETTSIEEIKRWIEHGEESLPRQP